MANKPRDYNQELASIMNAMAESTLDLTDEEIEAEIREEGGDPDTIAEHVRDVLRQAIKECQQRPLMEAQKRYDERLSALREKQYQMPELPAEQREMINTLLAANPHLRSGAFTAQFRDFNELADEDVGSYLRQLLELIEASSRSSAEEGEK
jgi:AcrR family transcriptional regulator